MKRTEGFEPVDPKNTTRLYAICSTTGRYCLGSLISPDFPQSCDAKVDAYVAQGIPREELPCPWDVGSVTSVVQEFSVREETGSPSAAAGSIQNKVGRE